MSRSDCLSDLFLFKSGDLEAEEFTQEPEIFSGPRDSIPAKSSEMLA